MKNFAPIRHLLIAVMTALMSFPLVGCANLTKTIIKDDSLFGDLGAYQAKDIFMALPASYFEISLTERAQRLNSKDTKISQDQKEIIMPGDGAQSTIRMVILNWSSPDYTVRVYQDTGEQVFTTTLRRIPGGWKKISTETSSARPNSFLPH